MPHIIFYDQNIVLKCATWNTKEPKNLKTHNKLLELMPWKGKNKDLWPLGIGV